MPFLSIKIPELCSELQYYDSQSNLTPLVALTANPGDIRDYDAVRGELEKDFRFIGLNWPGYGGSAYPGREVTKDGALYFYRVLVEFLKAINVEKCVLIGNSVGGFAACKLAIDHPEMVSKMVLVSSGGFSPSTIITRSFCGYMGSTWSISPRTFASIYLGHKDAPVVKEMLERAKSESQSSPTALEMIRTVWRSFNNPEYLLIGSASKVTAPTMLIFGKHDPVITTGRDEPSARKAFGDGKATIVVMNSAHCPFAEIPEEFLKQVLPFLKN